jgi:hypothetical protein
MLSTGLGRPVTRLNVFVTFDFEASTTAFDSFTVPSMTMEPGSFAALSDAARHKPFFSDPCGTAAYSLVIIPTRSVKNALADPDRIELASRCMPGIAATVEPKMVPTRTST